MHIARVGERLPRLQIQFRISRSFRSKIRFWICQKEHTLNDLRDNQWVEYLPSYFCSHYRVVDFLSIPPPGIYHPKRRKILTPGVYPGEAWAHLELTDA